MLLDSEQFADSSPFKMSHPVNYNLPNTTSDLLKFQLQQHHKLERLEKNKALDDGVNSVGQESGPLSGSDGSVGVSGGGSGAHPILHSSNVLNGYLQASIDTGNLAFDPETSLPGLSDSPSFDESTSSSDTEVSSSHMNTTNDTTINHSTKVPLKEDDVSIEAFIAQASSKPNYLNFKVLMENAIFDVSNINRSSILPFHLVKSLKLLIEDKKELKEYLFSKINISHEFINDMILHPSNSSSSSSSIPFHEPGLLTKVIKANYKLQTELTKVDQELETLVNKLNNHNLACLLLGYMEDINLSSASHSGSISMDERGHSNIYDGGLTSAQSYKSFDEKSSSVPVNNFSDESPIKSSTRTITTQPSAGTTPTTASNLYFGSPLRRHQQQQQLQKQQNDRLVDNLLSYIALVAAQHSFTLPSPPKGADSTLPQLLEWAQQCFEAILTQQAQTQAQAQAKQLPTPPATTGNETNNKVITDLKTALNDLRFSHEYLTKEYEYERESSHKTIQEYRRKLISLERDLQKSKYLHNLTASNGFQGDSGKKSISTSASTSSLLGPSVELVVKDQEISRLRKELNQLKIEKIDNNSQPPSNLPLPSLNVVQLQSVDDLGSVRSNDGSVSPVGGQQLAGASLSSGILRKEFRKIVSDMQDQYELELSQERLLRRQLQEELDKR
ncbi:uncharacterized protein KQ657_000709 [Scheffersomyces spartinae]|uniref:Uncharacterized protein n=1 Tax=Scheffersomyces spartinae TaxID=45513 RepID=A0A9P7V9G1_9ASCO|nr:uncharacterized protein KQ657_000709 [Scheffersomyces spartinae]KAG7193298.1 hypothetical protein KQ657_000709 [Scheffersomyces spartinae]